MKELTASELGKRSQQIQREKLGEEKYRLLKAKYANKRWKKKQEAKSTKEQ